MSASLLLHQTANQAMSNQLKPSTTEHSQRSIDDDDSVTGITKMSGNANADHSPLVLPPVDLPHIEHAAEEEEELLRSNNDHITTDDNNNKNHSDRSNRQQAQSIANGNASNPTCTLDDDHYHREFYEFKQRVKNKRKSTFCTIFSIGSLILAIVLILAPLGTQMLTDWKLYQHSEHTQCTIVNITYLNGTQYTQSATDSDTVDSETQTQCIYHFETSDAHNLSATCLNAMHEQQACEISHGEEYHIGDSNECCFYKDESCQGTMIGVLMLQRNNTMFVLLLGIGGVFAITTVFTAMYAIRMIHLSGIYCSVMAIQNDDDKAYELLTKFREHMLSRKQPTQPQRQPQSQSLRGGQILHDQLEYESKQNSNYKSRSDELSSSVFIQMGSTTLSSTMTANSRYSTTSSLD